MLKGIRQVRITVTAETAAGKWVEEQECEDGDKFTFFVPAQVFSKELSVALDVNSSVPLAALMTNYFGDEGVPLVGVLQKMLVDIDKER